MSTPRTGLPAWLDLCEIADLIDPPNAPGRRWEQAAGVTNPTLEQVAPSARTIQKYYLASELLTFDWNQRLRPTSFCVRWLGSQHYCTRPERQSVSSTVLCIGGDLARPERTEHQRFRCLACNHIEPLSEVALGYDAVRYYLLFMTYSAFCGPRSVETLLQELRDTAYHFGVRSQHLPIFPGQAPPLEDAVVAISGQ